MALRLKGSSSGYAEIDASADAGSVTLTLPATAGTINVKDGSGTTNVGTGVNLGNPEPNVFTISTNGSERLRIAADGGVSIPGVLTYEDVTSVDAIGLSTFREGLNTKDVGITTITSSDINGATAVDVFVYDTSKDSDGGAWRKRTSHTSWYNEDAAAGVRGSRKEFPAVAVIVAEAAKVTIYDGDDPDLPMWMVFNHSGAGINATTARNGVLYWGCSSASSDRTVYFIKDSYYRWWTTSAYTGYFNEPISGRNGTLTGGSGDTQVLVNGVTNDVAMTVLPNAPIDSATGLPIPTIAVATDGGVSVIKDDGNVVNKSTSNVGSYVSTVDFTSDYNIAVTRNNYNYIVIQPIEGTPSSSNISGWSNNLNYFRNNGTNYPGPLGISGDQSYGFSNKVISTKDSDIVSADSNGLNIFNVTRDIPSNANMVAYATTSYNTGWMHGDIKGALLSDTDTTNVTGGGDGLITGNDSTFGAVITSLNWSERSGSGGGWNVSGGVLKTGTVSSGEYLDITTSGYTSGQTYVISYTLSNVTGSNPIRWRFNNGQMGNLPTSNGSHSYYVTLTETGTLFSILNDSSLTADIDNFRLQLVQEEDRSVNNFGLVQYGTITKSAVATGADLVAYSGFSASNYLQQPYNSDLDFGTGDFSIMFWFKTPSGSVPTECILHRGDGSSGWGTGKIIQIEFNSTNLAAFLSESAFSSFDTVTVTGTKAATGQWMHYTLVRSGTSVKVYLNGEVNGTITSSKDLTNTSAKTWIGERPAQSRPATTTSLALMRMSKSAPSPEQIKKMYEDEKHLYQENAKCTLHGSSDAVTALGYDETTDQLHVGTSGGRSDFQGLRRINNTTQQVETAISAHDTFIIEQ